jgi:hypothetical protein
MLRSCNDKLKSLFGDFKFYYNTAELTIYANLIMSF